MRSRPTASKRTKLLIAAALATAMLAGADGMAGNRTCNGLGTAWASLSWIPSGTVLRPFALFDRLCPA